MKRLLACLLACLSMGIGLAKTNNFSMEVKESSLGSNRYLNKIIANYQMTKKFENDASVIYSNERNDFIEINTFNNSNLKIESINVYTNKKLKSRTTITGDSYEGISASLYEKSLSLKSGGSSGDWSLTQIGSLRYFLAGVYFRALSRGEYNSLNYPEDCVTKDSEIINQFKNDKINGFLDIFFKDNSSIEYLFLKVKRYI